MRKFPRTFHALDAERPGLSIVGLGLVTLLLTAWLVWLFGARISVFEVTPLGRLEVDRAAYPITSRVDGRATAVPMIMGRRVEAGDLLVQLETTELEIRLAEEEARLASIRGELEAVRAMLDLRRRTAVQNRHASTQALEGARARWREIQILAEHAQQEAERFRVLFEDGHVSRSETNRLRAEAERLRESTNSYRIAAERQETEIRTGELADQTEVAQLRRSEARLEGDSATAAVTLDKIRYDIEQRSIRAPHDGEVSDVIDLPVMSMVREGDRLGTILGSGDIRLIGEFAAASALGRVRIGQQARVRLDGFPWTQYGMLSASVARVAREPRAGRLRVELEIDAGNTTRVPLLHGLTGTVEIEVERISPVALLLRTLGKTLDPKPRDLTLTGPEPGAQKDAAVDEGDRDLG